MSAHDERRAYENEWAARDERIAALVNSLRQVSVRGSLEAFAPLWFVHVCPDASVDIVLEIDVANASHDGHRLRVPSHHPLTPYQVDRYGRRPLDAAAFIRAALQRALEHELDESVWIGDERLREPKHWGPTARQRGDER